MLYPMRESQLRQREPLEAAIILALSLGLAGGLRMWLLALLGAALALSLLRDAHLLRRQVREGKVWICEGRVQAISRERITLRQGGETMTLRLSKPLRIETGCWCRLALQQGKGGYHLLGMQTRACRLRLVTAA